MPHSVDRIVDAIRRKHPDYDEEKIWAIAYETYKDSRKGKEAYADDEDVVVGHMATSKKATYANDATVSAGKEAREEWGRSDMRPQSLVGNPKKKAAVNSLHGTQYEGKNMDEIEQAYAEYLADKEGISESIESVVDKAMDGDASIFKTKKNIKVKNSDVISKTKLKGGDGYFIVAKFNKDHSPNKDSAIMYVTDKSMKVIYSLGTHPSAQWALSKFAKNRGLVEGVAWNEAGYGFKDDIFHFLQKNPKPTDKDVHDFAYSLGVEPEELEAEIYALLADMVDFKGSEVVGVKGPMTQNAQVHNDPWKMPRYENINPDLSRQGWRENLLRSIEDD